MCYFRFGFPCQHYFKITLTPADFHQINPQYWLLYSVFYNSGCDIGNLLMKAQQEQFLFEGRGIPIEESILNSALECAGNSENIFPSLYKGTSPRDYEEAKYVLLHGAVTSQDLEKHFITNLNIENESCDSFGMDFSSAYDQEEDDCQGTSSSGFIRNNHTVQLSQETSRLHCSLEEIGTDNSLSITDEDKMNAFKSVKECLDYVTNDRHCRKGDLRKFVSSVQNTLNEYIEERNSRRDSQPHTGGYVFTGGSPVKGRVSKSKRYKGVGG